MSDTPRDHEPDADVLGRAPRRGAEPSTTESIEPTTGPPGPGASAGVTGGDRPGGTSGIAGAGESTGKPSARWRRMRFWPAVEPDPESAAGQRLRRRRRLFIAGIAVAAAIVVVALCAGALGIVSAINGAQDRADDARAERLFRNTACLEFEQRLNRLTPPGATASPTARAVAVQSENTAVRIYVGQIRNQRDQDAWRQLLDARTAYAQALNDQAKTRTPAFYVTPRTGDGRAVTDELVEWSPAACAGAIRRLATPDL